MKPLLKTLKLTMLCCLVSTVTYGQGLFTGLSACYPLNCSANDAHSNALHGFINGNVTCTTNRFNVPNSAMQFGGTQSDFISLPNNSLLKPSSAVTISGWFYLNSNTGQELVFTKNNCTSNFDAYYLYWAGGTFYTGLAGSGCFHSTATSSGHAINNWYHVVVCIDNSTIKLYVNNVPATVTNHSQVFNYDPNTGVILGGTNQSAANPPFLGKMDNVRFWNRTLTVAEVNTLYTTDPDCSNACSPWGLVSYWDFNGNLNDQISANNGTWQGTGLPNYVADRCGVASRALRFNGTNNYLTTTMPGPMGNSARSISFWMRTAKTTGINSVFCTGFQGAQTGSRWEICHNYSCQGIGVDISQQYFTRGTNCLNDGQWHHVVVTQAQGVSLANTLIYLDGVLINGNCAATGLGGINNTQNQNITIGAIVNGMVVSRYFNGDLDDIMWFNRVLTQSEVIGLRNCQCSTAPTMFGPTQVCQGKSYTYSIAPVASATYQWQAPLGWTIVGSSTSNVFVVIPGTNSGQVMITVKVGCVTNVNMLDVSSVDCCKTPQQGFGLIPNISGGGTFGNNNSYLIPNTVIVTNNTTFQDGEFVIAPNAQIIVQPNVVLTLDHSHLYSCGASLWPGIIVRDGGKVVSTNRNGSTLVEDAHTAIDVSGITSAHAAPPIDIQDVIFNKNHIGINITNAPGISTLPLSIKGCVFTSRNMPFQVLGPFALGSWPNADVISGLKMPTFFPGGLTAPYLLQNHPATTLKLPYLNEPGHIGINIINIDGQMSSLPSVGVDIGVTYMGTANDFNLFDKIAEGIHVENASLSTMNNVFQNMAVYNVGPNSMGGIGINDWTMGMENTLLDLKPSNQSSAFGNRFWNCRTAVKAKNVYKVDMTYGMVRSDRAKPAGFTGGSQGVMLESNRLDFNILLSEFNNIDTCVVVKVTNGPFDVNGPGAGTYADNIQISQNYFGPEIASAPLVAAGYIGQAILLDGNTGANWTKKNNCQIWSNKLNRVYRGINVDAMSDFPVEIAANNIFVEDDNFVVPGPQYGIQASNSEGDLKILQNRVEGRGVINPFVRLIRSVDNLNLNGNPSPVISCNDVLEGYIGFEFSGQQLGTEWRTNNMRQKMHIGLSIVNNAQIGVQGNGAMGSGNLWDDNGYFSPNDWMSNMHTFVFGNSFLGSTLWVQNSPGFVPINNGGASDPFIGDIFYSNLGTECVYPNNYPSGPSQRTSLPTSIEKQEPLIGELLVYPNPTEGEITIGSPNETESITLIVRDVTGKVISTETVNIKNHEHRLSLPVGQGIYLLDIVRGDGNVSHKKVVVSK